MFLAWRTAMKDLPFGRWLEMHREEHIAHRLISTRSTCVEPR